MFGLVFGIATLTWVVSGLISMNPWGFLEGRGGGDEQARVEGQAPRWSEVCASLDAVRTQPSVVNMVSLVTAPLAGQLYWLATQKEGAITRLDAVGSIAAVSETDLAEAARRIAGAAGIAEQTMITEEDAYYFRRHDSLVLPVYRVILSDEGRTRYYLDPRTGALLQHADANDRWHRWLFGGLHRIDFASWMRARPIWDIIVLIPMLGGLGLTGTGLYLAIRRVSGDIAMLFRFVARRCEERQRGSRYP
jgi:hypothetical protein